MRSPNPPLFARALVALCAFCFSCVDQPNPVAPPGGATPVDRLSQVGVYQGDLAQLQPATGFAPYDVDVSLYADGAEKKRLLYLPPGTSMKSAADRWDIPAGAYFVKTFYFPHDARDPSQGVQLVETRFLIREAAGYQVSTYLWNAEQTDAVVSGGNVDVPVEWIDQTGALRETSFHVPGTSLCQSCHQDRALGLRTRQMDLVGSFADGTTDQIGHLVAQRLLDARPQAGLVLVDPTGPAPLDARARSYLDANCSHCHGAGGIALGTGVLWDYDDTAQAALPLCRKVPAVEGTDQVIVPGNPGRSEFLTRMKSTDAFAHMPQGESHVPDAEGIAVLTQWVAQMTPGGCP